MDMQKSAASSWYNFMCWIRDICIYKSIHLQCFALKSAQYVLPRSVERTNVRSLSFLSVISLRNLLVKVSSGVICQSKGNGNHLGLGFDISYTWYLQHILGIRQSKCHGEGWATCSPWTRSLLYLVFTSMQSLVFNRFPLLPPHLQGKEFVFF